MDGLENGTAIELLTKLVDSLDTEGHDSTTLEVDVWLRSGNTVRGVFSILVPLGHNLTIAHIAAKST